MKRDYIKLPVAMLNDARYGLLTDDLWRLMVQLFLLAGDADNEGLLPNASDIAWILRIGTGTLHIALHKLRERGLVQSTPMGWVVTDFTESQAAPNSTERSRLFRKRHKSEAQEEAEGSDEAAQEPLRIASRKRTFGATEMQLFSHIPVSKPVPRTGARSGRPNQAAKRRRRNKPKWLLVEKPVDNFVEKGRNNSDLNTNSINSLIEYFNSSLKINKLLLVAPYQNIQESKSDIFNLSQENIREKSLRKPGCPPFAEGLKVPPGRMIRMTGNTSGLLPENFHRPLAVDVYPVDKPVDNSVEKGRNNSDPDDKPP